MSEVFPAFPKIPRLNRLITITEKIDGTNAVIVICDRDGFDGIPRMSVRAGSRSRWITPEDDNFGFARWVESQKEELIAKLGPGTHYGEWWGAGIGRRYNMKEKVFSLFNSKRWTGVDLPAGIRVVPVLLEALPQTFASVNGHGLSGMVQDCLHRLQEVGSFASPGFMKPEGIIVYHSAADQYFKVTIEKDEQPKG